MAERMILVCDVCGAPASQTVTFKASGRSLQKDLCATHLAELTAGAHAPKRGRRAGSTNGSSAAAPSRAKRTRKGTTSKAANGRRRKRTPKAPAEG